jgi:stearoyl-CoA desaturase (delta-9 desaturase)
MDEYGNWIYLTPMVLGGIASYPELMWLHKLEVLPAIMIAAICVLIAGWAGLVVGFLWSTVLLYHATFCINSLAHVQGTQALCHGR